MVFKEDVYPFKHTDLPISSLFHILEFSPNSVSDKRVTVSLKDDTMSSPSTISSEHSTDTLTSAGNPNLATDAHSNTLLEELPVDTSPYILFSEAPEPSKISQRVSKPPLWMKDYVIQSQGKSKLLLSFIHLCELC